MKQKKKVKKSFGKRLVKSLSKETFTNLKNKALTKIKSPPSHKNGRLNILAIALIAVSILLISLPIAQIISEDIFNYDLLKVDKVKKTEQTGKGLYKIDQPDLSVSITDDPTGGMDLETFAAMGFEAQEVAIIKALGEILGGWSPEKLDAYLGGLEPFYKAETIYRILPGAIAANIKFGTTPSIIVSQSAAEQGWFYPNPSDRSESWEYNNPFGIKGDKSHATNEYWTGEIEVSATSEGWGASKVNIKDGFRAYKSVWHACMDHSRLLGNDRYGPFNLRSETDPAEYARKLGKAGYYTDNIEGYASKMKNIHEGINGPKLNELANLVKEAIQREGGGNLSPNGDELFEDEFKPSGDGGTNGGGFGAPLENLQNYRITSWYGPRNTGIKGASKWHQGLDIGAPTGVKILASKSGTVTQARWGKGYGNFVEVKHNDGLYTRYAHSSKLLVKVGDKVNKGDPIALVGNTGIGSGPHLHFEIRKKNDYIKESSIDHMLYYDKYQSKGAWYLKPKSGDSTGTGSLSNGNVGSIGGMPDITEKYITNTNNFSSRGGNKVEYIIIHETLNFGKGNGAKWHATDYFQNNKRGVSAHYTVDDKNIYNLVPNDKAAHHAGKNIRKSPDPRAGISNKNSIGIELCVNEDSNWDKTRKNAIYLTAQLLVKYGLTPDKVYNHNDVSGKKSCPEVMMNRNPKQWPAFKKDVEKVYNQLTKDVQQNSTASNGKTVKAEFTAYYPDNDPLQGGMYDSLGNRLKPDDYTCAAPKEIPFGTKITVQGTGTDRDGKTYTVTDRGGAIKVKPDGTYRIDLLMHTKSEAYKFGRRKGKAIIGGSGGNTNVVGGSNTSSNNSNNSSSSSNDKISATDKLTVSQRKKYRREIKKIFDEFGSTYDVNKLADDRIKLIMEVMKHQTRNNSAKQYSMGGNGPNIFDCSGLMGYVYKNALGITLPRSSSAISTSGMFNKRGGLDSAVPGDIVWNPGHVAMYMGKTKDGKVLVADAYSKGKPIGFRKVSASKGKKYLYPAEMLNSKPSSTKPSSTKVSNLNDFLFVGDSFTVLLQGTIKSNTTNTYIHAKSGSAPSYWLNRVNSMPDNSKVKGVVLLIGVNGAATDANKRDVKTLITSLSNKYPNKTIYVQKVFPTGRNFKTANPTSFNKKIAVLNDIIESHCNTLDNVKFINTQQGFVDSNGYLLHSNDGLHISSSYNQKFYDNIVNAVKNAK